MAESFQSNTAGEPILFYIFVNTETIVTILEWVDVYTSTSFFMYMFVKTGLIVLFLLVIKKLLVDSL